MGIMGYTLERRTVVIVEEHSKSYSRYAERAPQAKPLFWAKNDLLVRTCFELERHGV